MTLTSLIRSALERLSEVKPGGKGWRTRCPNPDHIDSHPSFFLYPGGGGRCFTQCGRYWTPHELAELLGVTIPNDRPGLTLDDLAQGKGIPIDDLRRFGVSDGVSGVGRVPCVDIPYTNETGEVVAVRKRLRMEGSPRFIWRRGDRPILYGLAHLKEIRQVGKVIIVEGESDCWTLWHNRIAALALPGATMWREEYRHLLNGVDVHVWIEPDEGGESLLRAIGADLPDARIMEAPTGAKDPSELYLQDPGHFRTHIESLMSAARCVSDIRAEAFSAEARAAREEAQELLHMPDILSALSAEIAAAGYAGDARPAIMAFIIITSRLTEAPDSATYLSPSASGKNAAIDAALPFFPESAYYLIRASSPRALVYNDEQFAHRIVILTEADNLPEDGPAASAVRSLMSDREMSYEVVEKGADGKYETRRIVKPGPTGLITTSTKPLGDQASTRMLTVTIPDSAEQTQLILQAQADKANFTHEPPDTRRWIALQRWLELAGERRIVIPFARALSKLIPTRAVRVRRDFAQLLIVIKTVAMLRQLQREKDAPGRIIATLDDYADARWLVEGKFMSTLGDGLTPVIEETVETVACLSQDGSPTTLHAVAAAMGVSKGTASYRVGRAIDGGWVVNKAEKRGIPAQLVIGDPLPDVIGLPEPDALSVCVGGGENHSNTRTPGQEAHGTGVDSVRIGVEHPPNLPGGVPKRSKPHSNSGTASQGDSEEVFEVFERFEGGTTHTEHEEQTELPWDEFLDEQSDDE